MQCLRFTMDHRFQLSRSTHSQMFFKKCVLNNFANFTEKHLCCSLFIKKRLQHWCFPVKFAKLIRTAFFQNTFFSTGGFEPQTSYSQCNESLRDHPFSMYAKFSKKRTFIISRYSHVLVVLSG